MKKILIKNAVAIVATNTKLNAVESLKLREGSFDISNNSMIIADNKIEKIGKNLTCEDADEVIDAKGMVVYPGLVCTHHHLMQCFARNIPASQNMELFEWLGIIFEVLSKVDPAFMYYSMMVSGGELLKYGCTTLFDHQYSYPREQCIELADEQFRGADELGIRYIIGRGVITRSTAEGGTAPAAIVEDLDHALKTIPQVIEKYNDKKPFSMHGAVVAPCSPFTVNEDTMIETVKLARALGARLHTHLCETLDEEKFCLEKYGMRPLAWMQKTGCIGPDTWYAHGIHFNDEELKILAETKTGIAHCPISNMKLASGVCRVPEMIKLGVPLSLAVDGSGSNDGSDMLEELRTSFLVHRLTSSYDAPTGAQLLNMATIGGAHILGIDSYTGSLEEGKAADLFMLKVDDLDNVGAYDDPIAMLATVGYKRPAALTMVNGEIVVRNGQLTRIDEEKMSAKATEFYKTVRYTR